MAKEFNLSKKMLDPNGIDMLHKEDVKEFIKRLKEEYNKSRMFMYCASIPDLKREFERMINKLAGDDLK